jgi:hypothetical protein
VTENYKLQYTIIISSMAQKLLKELDTYCNCVYMKINKTQTEMA